MSLRGCEAEPLAEWLHDSLSGAALHACRQSDADTVVLSFRRPGRTIHLLLSARRGSARFHTVERPPPNPPRPHAFQGLLRADLHGPLIAVHLRGGDRLLDLVFPQHHLLLQFMGGQTDLLLLDPEDRVLGSLRSSLDRGEPFETRPGERPDLDDRFAASTGDERDAAIRKHYEERERQDQQRALEQRLRSHRKSLLRRAAKQEIEAQRAEDAGSFRHQADLLRASFKQLRKGLSEVEVFDWDGNQQRRITLDPSLAPSENIDRLYKRARRAERSGEVAQKRLELTRLELAALEAADSPEELQQLLPTQAARKTRRGAASRRLPYRAWRTSNGTEIRVGRGARDNDELTFRHARGNDVWMHVRGRPGAHVVIRSPGQSPPLDLLKLGAQLALLNSGIQGGASEEVAWTRVKEVTKPKGMAPGKVLIRTEQVLYLKADPSVLDSLERL